MALAPQIYEVHPSLPTQHPSARTRPRKAEKHKWKVQPRKMTGKYSFIK